VTIITANVPYRLSNHIRRCHQVADRKLQRGGGGGGGGHGGSAASSAAIDVAIIAICIADSTAILQLQDPVLPG